MWCWCLSVTGTTGLNILIHSRKIGFEVSMAKSELSDCCKLMSGELIKENRYMDEGRGSKKAGAVKCICGRERA